MKIYTAFIVLLLVLMGAQDAAAQKRNMRDSCVSTGFMAASYGYFMPGGDMYERFGNNSTIGTFAGYKTKKNNFNNLSL